MLDLPVLSLVDSLRKFWIVVNTVVFDLSHILSL
jgi:hypothetical protein